MLASARSASLLDIPPDCQTLYATTPPSWIAKLGWNTSLTCCVAQGIECSDPPQSYVISIMLPTVGLQGELPAGWGDMPMMERVFIPMNAIGGTLPLAWCKWKIFKFLNLEGNALWGPLVPEFGNWSSILSVNLNGNSFSGELPAQWSAWGPSVVMVDFSDNQLTGPVPWW